MATTSTEASPTSSASTSIAEVQSLPSAFFELPTTNGIGGRSERGLGDYIRRMRHWAQMDWELTMWQMVHLCIQPSKVYHRTKYHRQTKNQWARDDPGFVVLMVLLLVLSCVAWGLSFLHPAQIPKLVLYVLFVDFFCISVFIATVNWLIANWLVSKAETPHAPGHDSQPVPFVVKQNVEWLYAFDVHCNSFFPMFLLLYVLHYFLVPIILYTPLSTIVSNTLFLIAFCYYHYVTCLGFTALPFVHGTQLFLLPIPFLVLAYVLSLIFHYNISYFFFAFHFST